MCPMSSPLIVSIFLNFQYIGISIVTSLHKRFGERSRFLCLQSLPSWSARGVPYQLSSILIAILNAQSQKTIKQHFLWMNNLLGANVHHWKWLVAFSEIWHRDCCHMYTLSCYIMVEGLLSFSGQITLFLWLQWWILDYSKFLTVF